MPDDGDTVDAVRALANARIHPATALEVLVDGVVIADSFAYRAQSPPGGFALHFGSLLVDFAFPPAPDPRDPAVTDGYWVLLAPLRKGAHVIEIRSTRTLPLPVFTLEVIYYLTVGHNDD